MPISPEQQAEHDHADGVQQRTLRQHDGRDQAKHHQREIIRRAKLERRVGQRRRKQSEQKRRDRTGEKRPDRGGRQRRARAALLGHLIAVEGRSPPKPLRREG